MTVLLYNAMMNAAGKVFDMAEQQRLFTEMQDAGIRPNAISYNILLHVLGELKQVEQVADRYAEMIEKGVTPDVSMKSTTFSTKSISFGRVLD